MHGSDTSRICFYERKLNAVEEVLAALRLFDDLLLQIHAEAVRLKERVYTHWPGIHFSDLLKRLVYAAVRAHQGVEFYRAPPQAVWNGALGEWLLTHRLVNYDLKLLCPLHLGVGLAEIGVGKVLDTKLDVTYFDMECPVMESDLGFINITKGDENQLLEKYLS